MRRRHKHGLGYYKLSTFDMGQLIPMGLTEVLPGDTFQQSASLLIRLSPLAAPVMHPVTVRVHHFFVPHRLIWEKAHQNPATAGSFADFITSGKDGNDNQVVPTLPTTGTASDLFDYYGLPTIAGVNVSALPIAGFNEIWNEYFRDEDLAAERTSLETKVPQIAWEKDYLTSARPWPQKGNAVTLPVGSRAPVKGLGKVGANFGTAGVAVRETDGSTPNYANSAKFTGSAGEEWYGEENPNNLGFPNIYADLSAAEALPINEVRRAFALQRYAEARARYGSRLTEYYRYLGINPSDARLDRPEFLGGGSTKVAISEVLQTAPEAAGERTFGVGDLYGHGIAAVRTNAYRRFFEEHGYVHTLVSLRPKSIYTNSIPRTWLRTTRESFWQKELEHIGQQEVFKNEVFAEAGSGGNAIFGYQDRYREYRESPSCVTAEFRDVLNYWHLGRILAQSPTLNEAFIECIPSKRIYNEQTRHSLWVMGQHRIVARRLLSRTASPRIL